MLSPTTGLTAFFDATAAPTELTRFSPAKVNVWLHVGERLANGYHELETLMLPISWGDKLTARRQPSGVTLSVQQVFDFTAKADEVSRIPTDESNLIVRIAQGLLRHCHISTGVHFDLFKSIPAGGGLGGASSNAATALLLLNDLFGLRWTWRRLAAFSADFGSDIAFFTQPQAAICTGRGEQVAPCSVPTERPLVVIRPPFGLSTPAVFAELARRRARNPQPNVSLRGKIHNKVLSIFTQGGLMCSVVVNNDLEEPAVALKPELEVYRRVVASNGPLGNQMTGSGSCWYAVFRQKKQALWAKNRLASQRLGRIGIARSISSPFAQETE
jgi:4-diphosphocytidyl-2-C-methyl-D-erythritol kinase